MRRQFSGQIGLMLLVIMAVVVALVLSLASRSLSNTVLSRQDVESNSAFQLSESGVESALNQLRQGTVPSGATTQTSGVFTSQYTVQTLAAYSLFVREGEQAHLDTSGLSGALTIMWTKKSDASENVACVSEGNGKAPAALSIAAYQGAAGTVHYAYYNPYGCTLSGNGFAAASAGTGGYLSSVSYTPPAGTTFVRLMPLYSNSTVSVAGSGLSTQLYLIQSSTSGGSAQSDIQVQRTLDAPGSIFDYALFSGGTIQ